LKVLFGTATVTDMNKLHSTVNALSQKQVEVVHALTQQVTYFRQLDGTVKFNHQATAKWSAIKDFTIKTQGKFQKVLSKLEWALKQQEATSAVRELEFALTQLDVKL
jgi:hypothetical protein